MRTKPVASALILSVLASASACKSLDPNTIPQLDQSPLSNSQPASEGQHSPQSTSGHKHHVEQISRKPANSAHTLALLQALTAPMNYVSHSRERQMVTVETSRFPLRLEILADDVVKVRFANQKTFGSEYTYAVVPQAWAPVKFDLIETEANLQIKTGKIVAVIQKKPLEVAFYDPAGNVLLDSDGLFADPLLDSVNRPPSRQATERIVLGSRFKMQKEENFYGLGLKVRAGFDQSLNWRGKKRDSDFSVSHMGNRFEGADGGANGNVLIPFYLSSRNYGFFLDTPYKTYWEFDNSDYYYIKLDCDTDWEQGVPLCQKAEMRYYVIGSGSPKSILNRYTQLTGRSLMPPRWMFGYLQSNYGYQNWQQVHAAVDGLRGNQFPVDAIYLDLQWFGGVPGMHDPNGAVLSQFSSCEHRRMGDFKWSVKPPFDFSKAEANLKNLRSRGIKTVLIEEGYFDTCTNNFREAESLGFLAKKDFNQPNQAAKYAIDHEPNVDESAVGWAGQVGMVDTSNKAARTWFWSKHLPFIKQGAAGFWTDLGEPEKFRWWWKYDKGLWHQDIHNVWDFNRSKAFFEGYSKDLPNERPFVLSRSGYAGSQRFGVGIWSADTPSRLKWAATQPSAQSNLAISGISYFTSDIGGFGGNPVSSPEQFTRWLQFGLFSSLTRAHGNTTVGFNKERLVHPYQFPEPYKSVNRKYIQWRYSLIPYLYTHARETYETGMPLVRALPLHFPRDPNVADLGSQYLLGPNILVAPVLEGQDNDPQEFRDVYLPQGEWVDMHDGKKYIGGYWLRKFPAPLERMPVFARMGSIIPKAPPRLSTSAADFDAIRTLEIYPTDGATYTLYDDDGNTNSYKNASFGKTPINVSMVPAGIEIKIGAMKGSYPGGPQKRKYNLQLHTEKKPKSITLNGVQLTYSVHMLSEAESGVFWQQQYNRLYVNSSALPLEAEKIFTVTYE